MKAKLPTIYKHSQNLFNVLNSTFAEKIVPEIDTIFKKCIQNGGLSELDFIRPEGQSYNPRPARIALILINDSKIRDLTVISSAMLASISDNQDQYSTEANQISKAPIENFNYRKESKIIALALHLDRSRHFHLAPDYKNKKAEFHILTKKILDVAGSECQTVSHLLTHWLKRDERKN